MKKLSLLLMAIITFTMFANSQPPKTPPKEFPTTIPKHEVGGIKNQKPIPIKNIPFNKYIINTIWRGARIWYSPTSATVDSVLTVQFNANGTVTWVKQGWEYVNRIAGTYNVMGNKVVIDFSYPPYTHHLEGAYDAVTGKITGTFTETRAVDPNAPPAYTPGTTTGEFNFYKK